MTQSESAAIARTLGQIEGRLEHMERMQADEARRASESRGRTHARLDEAAGRLVGVEEGLKGVKDDVEEIKPFADRARRWEQRGIGALAAVGMIFSGLGAGIMYFRDQIVAALTGR